jgi:hypothetical protein
LADFLLRPAPTATTVVKKGAILFHRMASPARPILRIHLLRRGARDARRTGTKTKTITDITDAVKATTTHCRSVALIPVLTVTPL